MYMRDIVQASVMASVLSLPAVAGASLIENGDFSSGLDNWQNMSLNFGGNWTSASWEVSDDAPTSDALKMFATAGRNYSFRFSQEVSLSQSYSNFQLSYDWKVPTKKTPWGVNAVRVDFLSGTDVIGRTITFDTASDSIHTLDNFRGLVPADSFTGIHKYREIFDWETFTVDTTTDLPGLLGEAVDSINVTLWVQNDAGSGGDLFVDNIVVEGTPAGVPVPPTALLLFVGLSTMVGYRNKRAAQ